MSVIMYVYSFTMCTRCVDAQITTVSLQLCDLETSEVVFPAANVGSPASIRIVALFMAAESYS